MRKVLNIIYSNRNKAYPNISNQQFSAIIELLFYYIDIPNTPRYLCDGDAVYFYNFDECISGIVNGKNRQDTAQRGDIMMSFWMPFTYYLGLNHGHVLQKNCTNISKLIARIEKSEDGSHEDTEIKMICSLMKNLVSNYMTRGNLLLLPNTANQRGRRNFNPDRGRSFQDKIDQTLWHCFEGGKLYCYFKEDEKNVVEWIKSEHLECMFDETFFENTLQDIESGKVKVNIEDSVIKKENIQALVSDKQIDNYNFQSISKEDKEWEIFFERINKIIAYRNNVNIKSHLPFEWN